MAAPNEGTPPPGPADAAGFFFHAAPVAVACAGVTLLLHAERALLDSWSPITMGLTHFITLGFVSMTAMGAFYRTAPRGLDRPAPGRGPSIFAFAGFAIGVVALCVGLAGTAVRPVFVAIGALFPALAAFFWPALRTLRGTRNRGTRAAGWRIAVGAFLTVSVLGIWVAHGHGGMEFPGPRSLWIQLHLSIALFGWVGAGATAVFASQVEATGCDADDLPRLWSRLATWGVVLPSSILAADYVGAFDVSAETARRSGLLAAAPAAFATALWSTRWAWRQLERAPLAQPDRWLWRAAFAFAPLTLAAAALALWRDDAMSRVLFGWVAIWGWAGLVAHATLRSLAPPRWAAGPLIGLHLLTLAGGLLATASRSTACALATGIGLIVLALALWPARRKG